MAGRPMKQAGLALLEQLGEEPIIARLEAGKSIEAISKEMGITRAALNAWLDKPEHAGLASRARARAADQLAAEVLEIVDAATPETVNVARLQVDGRKWVAAKWNPAAYGDTKGPQVVVNIGDLHLRALKQSPVITVESTPLDADVTDSDDGDMGESML